MILELLENDVSWDNRLGDLGQKILSNWSSSSTTPRPPHRCHPKRSVCLTRSWDSVNVFHGLPSAEMTVNNPEFALGVVFPALVADLGLCLCPLSLMTLCTSR